MRSLVTDAVQSLLRRSPRVIFPETPDCVSCPTPVISRCQGEFLQLLAFNAGRAFERKDPARARLTHGRSEVPEQLQRQLPLHRNVWLTRKRRILQSAFWASIAGLEVHGISSVCCRHSA